MIGNNNALERYRSWLKNDALPFWQEKGANPDTSLFWEKLTFDGSPDESAELRVRTQFRQIYVFAHAATLGLLPDAALDLAVRVMERLSSAAWAPDGRPGWVHRIDRDGSVLDARRDLYDHAFALLALAHLRAATGDAVYQRRIDDTLDFIDRDLATAGGGWAESDQRELPRRQNPHMHLFEASLALFETGGEARYLARASEIYGLFRTRFFDDKLGTLREFFGPKWQVGSEYGSDRLDPGHMMEWVWLLRRYSRSSRTPVDDLCRTLFDAGLRLGLDRESGFLVDEVDTKGKRLVNGRRLWLQTEYLKALLVQFEATGDGSFHEEAGALCERLFASYLAGPFPGGWYDRFALDGTIAVDTVPASILYHLLVPITEMRPEQ